MIKITWSKINSGVLAYKILGVLDRVNHKTRRKDNVLRDRNHPLRQNIGIL